MGRLVIPDGFGQATIKFACTGVQNPMVTTFGYAGADAESGPAAVAANANTIFGLLTSANTKLLNAANISTDYRVLGVEVAEYIDGEVSVGVSNSAPVVGAVQAPAVPPNCAVLVRKGTALGGRKGRGRMYFPPLWIGENFVSAAGVLDPSISTHQTRMNTLLTDLTTAGLPMVLHHSDGSGGPNGGGDFVIPPPTTVTSLVIQTLLATQRRRMR